MDSYSDKEGVFSSAQQEPALWQGEPPRQEPGNPEKKPGPVKKFFGGIVLSFLILGIFIGIQLVVTVVAMVAEVVPYVLETGETDAAAVTRILQRVALDNGFVTRLTLITTAVSAVIAVFFYWLLWGRKRTQEDKRYFRENVLKLRPIAMISVSAVGLYYLAVIIAAVIGAVSPALMEDYSDMMDMALGGSEALALIAAVILAPINEECIMRGFILRNLRKYFSVPVVIVIQAVMFGIFHMNWVQGIYVLPIGAALGFVAIKSRSVLPCIYMHLFYNLMSFVSGVLPDLCQTNGFCVIVVCVSAAVVGIIAHTYREKEGQTA